MLFHSVAMVRGLSPCYKVFPKLQIWDQTLYSFSIVKVRYKSACSSSKRLRGKSFHKLFEKTSTVRIKVTTSVLATDTGHFAIPQHMAWITAYGDYWTPYFKLLIPSWNKFKSVICTGVAHPWRSRRRALAVSLMRSVAVVFNYTWRGADMFKIWKFSKSRGLGDFSRSMLYKNSSA